MPAPLERSLPASFLRFRLRVRQLESRPIDNKGRERFRLF